MPDPRLDSGEEIDEEEEEEDEEVSDNPLPAWLEGDSLAPPCQVMSLDTPPPLQNCTHVFGAQNCLELHC